MRYKCDICGEEYESGLTVKTTCGKDKCYMMRNYPEKCAECVHLEECSRRGGPDGEFCKFRKREDGKR